MVHYVIGISLAGKILSLLPFWKELKSHTLLQAHLYA